MQNTLFIMFYFPPFARVGGRRWAKHIKYFKKQNENFLVLAGDYKESSPWDKDIETYKDKITRIPIYVYYPYFKQILPSNVIEKIKWKISFWNNNILEKRYKGNFWDDSRGYENDFLTKAIEIIKANKINHICLSVGPFSHSIILPEIKKQFPEIKITLDFRDYWEDSLNGLSEKNKKLEKEKSFNVIKAADLILAPNSEMCNFYTTNYSKKTYCLPHCIDEDFLNYKKTLNQKVDNKTLIFLYGGNLYDRLEKYINEFVSVVKQIEKLGYKVFLKILTAQANYDSILKQNNINFSVSEQLPTGKFIDEALKSDVLLLFRPDWSPNGFSTKFFESLALRKPILYFGPNGDVNNYLQNHQLGFSMLNNTHSQLASQIIDNLTSADIPNKNYSLDNHTFEFQTKKLINFWNSFYEN